MWPVRTRSMTCFELTCRIAHDMLLLLLLFLLPTFVSIFPLWDQPARNTPLTAFLFVLQGSPDDGVLAQLLGTKGQ